MQLRESVRSDPASVHSNPDSSYVPLTKEGNVIGSGWLDKRDDLGQGTAEVSRVDIRPEHQGKGLAKELYERLHAEVKRKGYTRLVSDSLQTPEAVRAWEGMAKRGLAKKFTDPYGNTRYEYLGKQ